MLINQVVFAGNAVNDAKEVYEAGRDEPHVLLVIAWSDRSRSIERRCFVPIRCYGAVADIAKHVKRGEGVMVQGRLDAFDELALKAGLGPKGCAIVANSVCGTKKLGPPPTTSRVFHPQGGAR